MNTSVQWSWSLSHSESLHPRCSVARFILPSMLFLILYLLYNNKFFKSLLDVGRSLLNYPFLHAPIFNLTGEKVRISLWLSLIWSLDLQNGKIPSHGIQIKSIENVNVISFYQRISSCLVEWLIQVPLNFCYWPATSSHDVKRTVWPASR